MVTGRDGSRSARTLKRALDSWAQLDRGHVPRPRADTHAADAFHRAKRTGIRGRSACAPHPATPRRSRSGCSMATVPTSGEADQRKIERIFFREDYRRAGPARSSASSSSPHALSSSTRRDCYGPLDVDAIRAHAPKVVVDYAFGRIELDRSFSIGPARVAMLSRSTRSSTRHRPVLTSGELDRLLENLADHVRNSGSDLGVLARARRRDSSPRRRHRAGCRAPNGRSSRS